MTENAGHSLADRAAALLNDTSRVAMPLPQIARRLEVSPAAVIAQVQDDDRFVLIPPTAFPDLAMLPEDDRSAYDAALASAGVHGTPCIALREPLEDGTSDDVDLLLRNSVARLLGRTPEPSLLAAAERVRMAVTSLVAPRRDPVETDPSTTPLPDPIARRRDPPRRRRPPHPKPPYPGSRRE